MDVFKLSRNWFNWCFDNPEKVSPNHSAVYFFAIEHCNRLGWKQKFGFPSQMAMEAVGIKNWRTFIKALNDLIEWGFINLIEKSKNQYSSNIIAIVENTEAHTEANTIAHTKALDKALQKHIQKQSRSIVSIDIQETRNKKQETRDDYQSLTTLPPQPKKNNQSLKDTLEKREREFKESLFPFVGTYEKDLVKAFFEYWSEPDKIGKMRFEKEKTWETGRRLAKWKQNDEKFKSERKTTTGLNMPDGLMNIDIDY